MPSVWQGQGMRTHSAQLPSMVSWMKSSNPRLRQLLFKLVQRPTCLWRLNPISWVITPGRIWTLLCVPLQAQPSAFVAHPCHSKGKFWEQLLGSEPWTRKSLLTITPHCGEGPWFLLVSPHHMTEEQSPNSSQRRLPEQTWEGKIWSSLFPPSQFYISC